MESIIVFLHFVRITKVSSSVLKKKNLKITKKCGGTRRFNAVSMIYVYVHILVLSSQICLLLKFSKLITLTLTNPNAPFHINNRTIGPAGQLHVVLQVLVEEKYRNTLTTRNTQIFIRFIQTISSKERGEEKYKHIQ